MAVGCFYFGGDGAVAREACREGGKVEAWIGAVEAEFSPVLERACEDGKAGGIRAALAHAGEHGGEELAEGLAIAFIFDKKSDDSAHEGGFLSRGPRSGSERKTRSPAGRG